MRCAALLCLCASTSPAGTDGGDQHDPFAPVTATFPAQAAERQKLGLSFYKGLAPPTISRIAEGSLAVAQPRLRVGLQLESVNGAPVGGLPFADAVALVRTAPRPMELLFSPPPARGGGGWIDAAPLLIEADDAALEAAMHGLSEDDAYDALAYVAPRYPSVVGRLRRLVDHAWAGPRLLREAGLALFLSGDHRASSSALERAARAVPEGDPEAWRADALLGQLHCRMGRGAECSRLLRRAVALAEVAQPPSGGLAYAALIRQTLADGVVEGVDEAELVRMCRRLAALRPADAAARSLLVAALLRHGERAAAAEEYAALGRLVPPRLRAGAEALLAAAAQAPSDADGLDAAGDSVVSSSSAAAAGASGHGDASLCESLDCAVATNGRATECADGYCLCQRPYHGLRCAQTFEAEAAPDPEAGQVPGGALSSEWGYLRDPSFQLKQRLAASLVRNSSLVLEVGGGYQSLAGYLGRRDGGGPGVHHNVEPVIGGRARTLGSGWRTADLPLRFEDYRLPEDGNASALVVLGFTPTARPYCHSVLDAIESRRFDRVVLEAPVVGDLLGMSAIASAVRSAQRAGLTLVRSIRLDPCETFDPVVSSQLSSAEGVRRRQRDAARLPEDLHAPDCQRFMYVLERRPRARSAEAQALADLADGAAFAEFFEEMMAKLSDRASTVSSICAGREDDPVSEGSGDASVAAHVAGLLAESRARQPLAILRHEEPSRETEEKMVHEPAMSVMGDGAVLAGRVEGSSVMLVQRQGCEGGSATDSARGVCSAGAAEAGLIVHDDPTAEGGGCRRAVETVQRHLDREESSGRDGSPRLTKVVIAVEPGAGSATVRSVMRVLMPRAGWRKEAVSLVDTCAELFDSAALARAGVCSRKYLVVLARGSDATGAAGAAEEWWARYEAQADRLELPSKCL